MTTAMRSLIGNQWELCRCLRSGRAVGQTREKRPLPNMPRTAWPKQPWAAQRVLLPALGCDWHQESAAFLLHPDSPIKRLLVDHATGTGKTLIMLRMLDNYFDDDRPKVVIFPKDAVCDNFYQELLKWPTRWRHFFCFLKPAQASLASGAKDWRRKKLDVWDINNERSRAEAKARGVRLEKIISELTESIRQAFGDETCNSWWQGEGKVLLVSFWRSIQMPQCREHLCVLSAIRLLGAEQLCLEEMDGPGAHSQGWLRSCRAESLLGQGRHHG